MWVLSTHLVLSPKRKWIYTINSNKYLISCLSPPSGSKLELIVHQPGPQSPMGGQCSLATVTIQGQNCYWSLESFSLFNVGTRKCWHHFKFIFSLFYIYIYYTYLILRHSLADLELVTWARLALDSQRSTHLCFRSAGTKVCVTMPGWVSFIRRQQCYCLLESKSSFGENGNHSSNSRTMFLYDFL